MGEILVFQMTRKIDLIKNFENISNHFPNRVLKLEGYLYKKNSKEFLEIIIYKGFSSSTTHQIEIDLEKKVINFEHQFTQFKLYGGPLNIGSEELIRETKNSLFFLDEKNWN